jgi:hypothetical protein
VSGESVQDIGVLGRSQQLIGVLGEGKKVGVFGAVSDSAGLAGHFKGTVRIDGDLNVTGAKGAVVAHPDGSQRLFCAIESPESWFEDFGEARIEGGRVEVSLDPDFAQLTKTDHYHVFLTEYGDSNGLYVESRSARSFVVRERQSGKSSVHFSFRVVAKRRDADVPRFKKIDPPDLLRKDVPVEQVAAERGEEAPSLAPAATRLQPPAIPSRRSVSIEKPGVDERIRKRESE